MDNIFFLPEIIEREYPAFFGLTGAAPASYGLPATHQAFAALVAERRRERLQLGFDVRMVPLGLAAFTAYCKRTGEFKPNIVTVDRCAETIGRGGRP